MTELLKHLDCWMIFTHQLSLGHCCFLPTSEIKTRSAFTRCSKEQTLHLIKTAKFKRQGPVPLEKTLQKLQSKLEFKNSFVFWFNNVSCYVMPVLLHVMMLSNLLRNTWQRQDNACCKIGRGHTNKLWQALGFQVSYHEVNGGLYGSSLHPLFAPHCVVWHTSGKKWKFSVPIAKWPGLWL